MAEDEPLPRSKPVENPFSFNSFLENGSLIVDDHDEMQRSKNNKNAHSRYSYQGNTKSKMVDIFADEETVDSEEESNPFSFKEFVKKEKRGGGFISEGDDDSMGEDMGNQNGTAPAPSNSSQTQGTAVDGRPNQRRATSPGLTSRGKHKPTTKLLPPDAAEFETPPTTPQKTRKQQPKRQDVIAGQTEAGDFVDFIYDYATQNEDGSKSTPTHQRRAKNGARHSFGDTDAPPLPEKKVYARERARAHTHGHAIRKNKGGPPKTHPKSQLVVDYIDASDDANMFSSVSTSELNTKGSESPSLIEEMTRPKAHTEVKPHRERARAQSHGHRKHRSGDKQSKNKSSSGDQSDHEAKHSNGKTQSGENGDVPRDREYERRPSPPRKERAYDDLRRNPLKSTSESEDVEKPYDTVPIRNHSPSPMGSPRVSPTSTDEGSYSESSPDRLKHENSRLRRELAEARKTNEKDAKRIDTMEEELKRLRLREAEDAKTLEAMVQHVEANLKRTTERAVSAENTITNLKKEIKALKSENSTLLSEAKKFKEGKDMEELKERAHTASLKLAGAAKDAETNLKQLMSGVDVLKLMAQTLACFDKVSEHAEDSEGRPGKKGFGTAL